MAFLQRAPRPLDDILHSSPKSAAEERIVDRHIARECRRMRESWTPDEERAHRCHVLDGDTVRMFRPASWRPPVVAIPRELTED
jgi:hypothetical protein